MAATSGVYQISTGNGWLRAFEDSKTIALDRTDKPPTDDPHFKWSLNPSDDDERDFAIVNLATQHALSATETEGARVEGVPESASSFRWEIQPAGGPNIYHLQLPNENLYATVQPGGEEIALYPLKGEEGQSWTLHWVGDF